MVDGGRHGRRVPVADVRRAAMLAGDVGRVAAAALTGGAAARRGSG